MFDDQKTPAEDQPMPRPVDSINTNAGSRPVPLAPKAPPPADLPTTDQQTVKPKQGRTIPGTEDIFADTDKASAEPPLKTPRLNSLNFGEPTPTVMPEIGTKAKPVVMPEVGGKGKPLAGPPEPLSELPDDLEEEGGNSKKFFWIGLVVLIVILGGAGYYAYSKFFAGSLSLPKVNLNAVSPLELQKKSQADIVNLNFNRNVNQNVNQEGEEPAEEPEITCPELMPQAPDFCLDGEIVSGEEDENGCPLAPRCIRTEAVDSDRDGLTDAEEETLGTDPFEPDSDGDGLYDREEVKVYETDPLNPDTDSDGYLDGDEVEAGYDPKGTGMLLDLNFEE